MPISSPRTSGVLRTKRAASRVIAKKPRFSVSGRRPASLRSIRCDDTGSRRDSSGMRVATRIALTRYSSPLITRMILAMPSPLGSGWTLRLVVMPVIAAYRPDALITEMP
jgi:hypothetical protein